MTLRIDWFLKVRVKASEAKFQAKKALQVTRYPLVIIVIL